MLGPRLVNGRHTHAVALSTLWLTAGTYNASNLSGFLSGTGSIQVAAVPEPAAWALLGTGLVLLPFLRTRSAGPESLC